MSKKTQELPTRPFTFMVTVEAVSEQAAHDLVWRGIRNATTWNASKPGYRKRLYITNLVRSLSKYTKPHHLALFKERLEQRHL